MPRNTGKLSEEIFDEAWKRLGKRAYVYTFIDTAKASGRNNRRTFMDAQPSDRLLTFDGVTSFAEIKSSIDHENFKFSLLRQGQGFAAASAMAAGGAYDVYFHSLPYDRWFKIPYSVIRQAKDAGRGSFKISELEPYAWTFPTR